MISTDTNSSSSTSSYQMDIETFNKNYPLLNQVQSTSDDSKLTLNIFDFDSTLFKSPEPNPELWSPSMIGKLKAMKSEDGLGWFQETLTLDHPYVPISPSIDWFNEKVLNDCIKSLNTPNTITCLLTGRTFLYEEIIKRILESVKLKVNFMGLKMINQPDVERVTTMDFKKSFINRVLEKFQGRVEHVNLYDDRIKHIEQFSTFLNSINGITNKVVHINEKPQYLDEEVETRLVDELIARNGAAGYQKKKMVSYTGAVLTSESKKLVLSWFNLPGDWEIKCHHTTMNLGAHNPKLWKDFNNAATDQVTSPSDVAQQLAGGLTLEDDQEYLKKIAPYAVGKQIELQVEGVGLSGSALALKVSGCVTANSIPHITVAHHPKGKPVDSNFIQNWKSIDQIGDDKNQISFIKPVVVDLVVEPTTQSPKKQSFDFPNVTIDVNIPKESIKLFAIIKEVGQTSFEAPSKPKSSGGSKQSSSSNNNKLNIPELISKNLDINKNEYGKVIANIKKWMEKEKIQDSLKIEEYIKSIDLTLL